MNKKLVGAVIGAAALLAVAAPAFADDGGFFSKLIVKNTDTEVTNNVWTKANTGHNSISGDEVFGGTILTGNAMAGSDVSNVVNSTSVKGCGCFDLVVVKNRETDVTNNVHTKANTGYNSIEGGTLGNEDGGGAVIVTGDAGALASVTNVVNTTIVGGGL